MNVVCVVIVQKALSESIGHARVKTVAVYILLGEDFQRECCKGFGVERQTGSVLQEIGFRMFSVQCEEDCRRDWTDNGKWETELKTNLPKKKTNNLFLKQTLYACRGKKITLTRLLTLKHGFKSETGNEKQSPNNNKNDQINFPYSDGAGGGDSWYIVFLVCSYCHIRLSLALTLEMWFYERIARCQVLLMTETGFG